MKIIRYGSIGKVPSCVRDSNNRTNPMLKHWKRNTLELFKEQGLPTNPVGKPFKMKFEITHTSYDNATNDAPLSIILDYLVELGIIKSKLWKDTGNIEVIPKYKYNDGMLIVEIWADEKDPKNKDTSFDEMPVYMTV